MIVKDFLSAIIPPNPGDANGTNRWQWGVFMKVYVMLIFMVWALGGFGWLGFNGLARAGDVQELQATVGTIQQDLLESQLIATRREQCKAITDANFAARSYYGERLIAIRERYRQVTSRMWEVPPCDSI